MSQTLNRIFKPTQRDLIRERKELQEEEEKLFQTVLRRHGNGPVELAEDADCLDIETAAPHEKSKRKPNGDGGSG